MHVQCHGGGIIAARQQFPVAIGVAEYLDAPFPF
jgi:hypothetical protein